jgi:hypothetical protein
VRSVDRADRQRGRGFSTALSPLQNLSAYLERQQVPEARAQVLLELARRLVGEDEGTVEPEAPHESAPAVVKPAAEGAPPCVRHGAIDTPTAGVAQESNRVE